MRITAGEFRGRVLHAPKGLDVRPTQDRVREALFSMLQNETAGMRFLDLFAGTGGVGLEALSRGAAAVTFVEQSPHSLACIKRNIADLKAEARCSVIRADVYAWLRGVSPGSFDIAYADPPYAIGAEHGYSEMLARLAEGGFVKPGGLFIAEMRHGQEPDVSPGWDLCRDRTYGQTRIAIYRRGEDASVRPAEKFVSTCAMVIMACTLSFFSGCGCDKKPPAPYMDPAIAAAYAAIPAPGACRLLPSWTSVTNAAVVGKAIVPRDGSAAARMLVPGAVELPCAFSRVRGDRACWDIALPANLDKEAGVSFDLWCGDVTQFTGFSLYFKSGTGWYSTAFSPLEERSWHRVTIFKERVKGVEGKVSGWQAISGLRICGWRGGTNDTQLAVANISLADPPVTNTPEQVAEKERQDRQWAARQPAKKGEWRAFWCHSARGLGGGRSWDDTVRILKENGFNAVLPNMAWAGAAFYPSEVLPVSSMVSRSGDQLAACLAACRAYGVECHVWNVCWNLGHHASRKHIAEMAAAGRTQVRFDGTKRDGWLCPSHPDNLAMEIRSFTELARKGVDGIHFDYIRYPDDSFCFCPGCRARFEARYGISLTNWPAQVRQDPSIKAQWREFRISNITALVRGVSSIVRKESPGVKISAAVFQNPGTNPSAIGQDWADWCRAGYLDFVCPMNYSYDSPVAFKGTVFAQMRALEGSKTMVRPGIGLSCWQDRSRDIRMAVGEILAVREAGLDGFTIFNLDARAERLLPVLHSGVTR